MQQDIFGQMRATREEVCTIAYTGLSLKREIILIFGPTSTRTEIIISSTQFVKEVSIRRHVML